MSKSCFLLTIFVLAVVLPLRSSDKPDLSGEWVLAEPAVSENEKAVWVIEQTEENIRLRQSRPVSDGKTEIACTTRGQECKASIDGENASVRFWYNGPMLVEMRFAGDRGQQVTKTRRTLSADGKTMKVEVISISPPKHPQQFVFVRAEQQATRR